MRRFTFDLKLPVLLAGIVGVASASFAQTERSDTETPSVPLANEAKNERLPPGAERLPPPSAGELLLERARALDAREAELEEAKKDLALAEKRLDEKIARLEALLAEKKRRDEGLQSAEAEQRNARLARITEVTSKMPPENAAAYLSEFSADTAAQIMEGIKSRKAAAIMAAMSPSKAAEIGRNYMKRGNSRRQTSRNPKEVSRSGPDGANPPSP